MSRHTGAALCLLLVVGLASALSLFRSAAANRASAATHETIADATAGAVRQPLHAPTPAITVLPGPPTTPIAPPPPPLPMRPAPPLPMRPAPPLPMRPAPPLPGCSLPTFSLPGHTNAPRCVVPIPLARSSPCVTLIGLADTSSCAPPRMLLCPPSGFIPVDQPAQPCATVPRGAILIGHSAP